MLHSLAVLPVSFNATRYDQIIIFLSSYYHNILNSFEIYHSSQYDFWQTSNVPSTAEAEKEIFLEHVFKSLLSMILLELDFDEKFFFLIP